MIGLFSENNLLEFTPEGYLKKKFVSAHTFNAYGGEYTPNGITLRERTDVYTLPNAEKFRRELAGYRAFQGYFPVSPIATSDDDECSITYVPFLPNLSLEDLVKEVVMHAREMGSAYDIHKDPYGISLIGTNRELGTKLRAMHASTYSEELHTVEGSLDLHDRNVLVKKDRTNTPNGDFVVVDFESFDRIDVYHSMSVLVIAEMITATSLYNGGEKGSPFKQEYVKIILPALNAFFDGYLGVDDSYSAPAWLTPEITKEYNRKNSGIDLTLFSAISNQLGETSGGLNCTQVSTKILTPLRELFEDHYLFMI